MEISQSPSMPKVKYLFGILIMSCLLWLNSATASAAGTKYIDVGESINVYVQLTLYELDQGKSYDNYLWYSSDSKVAKVSSFGSGCKVTGVSKGTCIVSCGRTYYNIVVGSGSSNSSSSSSASASSSSAKKVKLNKSSLTLYKGRSKTLKCTVTPSSAKKTITWSSSDTSVATVSSSGKVTAKGKGTAVITATASSGKKSTCTVTVKIKANKIKLNLSSKKLYVGKKTTLKATLTPSGASGKVSWSSSDSSVAAVNKNGKVTAKKTGTAVITAELSNGKKATCKIKVYKKPTKIKLSKKTLKLECSKSATLTYKLSPTPTYGTVTWSSSNPSAVSVTKKGKVTALKQSSSAVITASLSNGVKATCTVTVPTTKADSISIKYKGLYEVETEYYYPGETAQYAVERTPSDAPGTVKWTSSNPSVAKISTTGELTCIGTGSTTITAVLGDCKATVAITVMGTQEYDVSRGDIRVDVDKGTISQPNGVTGVQTLDLGSPITLFGAKDGKGGASSTSVDVDNDNISSAYLKIVLNGIEFGKDSVGGCSLNFGGVQKGTVEISLAAGTSNYLHGDHAAIQLPSPYSNGPNIKITGSGYLYASCRKGVAIGNTGDWIGHLTIESGTIEMKGLSSMSIAIGGLGCEDVSIGANATLIVWDAEKVVGASKGSDYEKDISILGTVIRKSS